MSIGMLKKEKQAPIHPKQLTTERIDCHQCKAGGANNGDKNICKCSFCGIGTKDFIRGSLLEIYSKHYDYPIVLIENVNCPGLEDNIAYERAYHILQQQETPIGFIGLEDDLFKDYYIEKKPNGEMRVFHIFDLSAYYDCSGSGKCSIRRREDAEFKNGCIQSDLRTASDIMSGYADHSSKYTKKIVDDIKTPVYSYTCERNECPLIELAFPIMIDEVCVAVMIIGQIDPKQLDIHAEIMNEKSESPSVKKSQDQCVSVKEIAKCVDAFVDRMQERVNLRKSDFAYRFLTKIYGKLSQSNVYIEEIDKIIKETYMQIDQAFDYQELAVFYTDTIQEGKYSSVWFPEDHYKELTFDPDDLIHAMNNDNVNKLRELFSVESDENVGFYIQHSQPSTIKNSLNCFILTYIKWHQKEDENINNFFNSLNARLISLLMTKIAIEKQAEADEQKINQDVLIQTFSHDLNQKLEIVDTHTHLLDIKKLNWGSAQDSEAIEDVRNYIKDIQNLEMQLRHFTKEVRENKSGLPQTKDVHYFFPYGTFLFNLQEYYNSMDIIRKVYIPTPISIAINSANYPFMRADPVLIERCVNNLLSNASKYSYRYTNIYLDCYKKDNIYIIEVTNFTSPIKADVKERMFDMGVSQSKVRNYRQERGKGYGLAIVKAICDLHGGIVECIEEKISDYNIPILERLITILYGAETMGTLQEKLIKFKVDAKQYEDIAQEYDRLASQPLETWKNNVAPLFGKRYTIQEICNSSAKYSENMTAPSLHMALRMPTVRVRFRITLPQ